MEEWFDHLAASASLSLHFLHICHQHCCHQELKNNQLNKKTSLVLCLRLDHACTATGLKLQSLKHVDDFLTNEVLLNVVAYAETF